MWKKYPRMLGVAAFVLPFIIGGISDHTFGGSSTFYFVTVLIVASGFGAASFSIRSQTDQWMDNAGRYIGQFAAAAVVVAPLGPLH